MSQIKTITYAPEAWKLLNGIFVVYKPSGKSANRVRAAIKYNLCKGLNELEKRKVSDMVNLKGSVCTNKPYEVELVPNYADHELVSGPRYQEHDIRLKTLCGIGYNTSGVLLVAINDSCWQASNPVYTSFLRKYEIKGKFGIATRNFMEDGIVVERNTYRHIRQAPLDRVLSNIQSTHQALAFKYSGVDIKSQEAYEAAASGLVKPAKKSGPLIYSLKCIEFDLPYFTLEVYCLHETEDFLAELIHDIGVDVKCCAVCTQLRRVQFGPFTVSHALLRKHWTLEHILNNLTLCKKITSQINQPTSDLKTIQKVIHQDLVDDMQKAMREENLV